jgi:hypothetical protein
LDLCAQCMTQMTLLLCNKAIFRILATVNPEVIIPYSLFRFELKRFLNMHIKVIGKLRYSFIPKWPYELIWKHQKNNDRWPSKNRKSKSMRKCKIVPFIFIFSFERSSTRDSRSETDRKNLNVALRTTLLATPQEEALSSLETGATRSSRRLKNGLATTSGWGSESMRILDITSVW